jgi:hypothetical protein
VEAGTRRAWLPKETHMRRYFSVLLALMFVGTVGLFLAYRAQAHVQTPTVSTTQAQPGQPAKATRLLVTALPKSIEGIVLENGVFKLASGYKFVNQTVNTVDVALLKNGVITGTFSCGCYVESGSGKTPSGSCKVANTKEGALVCQKDQLNPCSDICHLEAKVDKTRLRLAIY